GTGLATPTDFDYFGARYYSNKLGRWVSADWSSTPEPVPYADLADPQSLNLYQFVGGNPASKADPDGHCCEVEIEIEEAAQNSAVATATEQVVEGVGKVGGAALRAPLIVFCMLVCYSTPLNSGESEHIRQIQKANQERQLHEAELQAQRGKQRKRESQFEGMDDDAVDAIARNRNDPRWRKAQAEQKSRRTRNVQKRGGKKATPTPPPTPTPTPTPSPTPEDHKK